MGWLIAYGLIGLLVFLLFLYAGGRYKTSDGQDLDKNEVFLISFLYGVFWMPAIVWDIIQAGLSTVVEAGRRSRK